MYHEIGMFNRSVVNGNSKVWPLASFAENCFIKNRKARWTDEKNSQEKMSCPFLAESVEYFDVSLWVLTSSSVHYTKPLKNSRDTAANTPILQGVPKVRSSNFMHYSF